jgi:hypothetical protein
MKTYFGYRKLMLDWQGKPTTSECVVTVRVNGRKRPLRPRPYDGWILSEQQIRDAVQQAEAEVKR